MSAEHLNAAFNVDVKSSHAKFVLLALGDYADMDGVSSPSIETLSIKTALNKKTVTKHLGTLLKVGAITNIGSRDLEAKAIAIYQLNINI